MTSTTKRNTASAPAQNIIPADSLLPGTDSTLTPAPMFWFWVGVVDRCVSEVGRAYLTLAGVTFPHRCEGVRSANAKTQRAPLVGAMVRLSIDDVHRIANSARNHFFRPVGKTDGGRPSFVALELTQPGEIEEMKRQGRPVILNAFQRNDVSAAELIYAVWQPTETVRVVRPGDRETPRPVSEVGIQLPPEDATPADSDMSKGLDLSFLFVS